MDGSPTPCSRRTAAATPRPHFAARWTPRAGAGGELDRRGIRPCVGPARRGRGRRCLDGRVGAGRRGRGGRSAPAAWTRPTPATTARATRSPTSTGRWSRGGGRGPGVGAVAGRVRRPERRGDSPSAGGETCRGMRGERAVRAREPGRRRSTSSRYRMSKSTAKALGAGFFLGRTPPRYRISNPAVPWGSAPETSTLRPGPRAAVAGEGHHRLDRVRLALEQRLDGAVRAVAHPTAHRRATRRGGAWCREEHPLHVAVDDDAARDPLAHARIVARGLRAGERAVTPS